MTFLGMRTGEEITVGQEPYRLFLEIYLYLLVFFGSDSVET